MKYVIALTLLLVSLQAWSGRYYDVRTGKWTSTSPSGSFMVSPTQNNSGRLINQQMLTGGVGWKCHYSDGSILTTNGIACPRFNNNNY
jgi:hypothetical protein